MKMAGNEKETRDKEIEELKKTVESLKEAIMDIRTTLSELENPFNLLKSITDIAPNIIKQGEETSQPKPEPKENEIEEKPETKKIEEKPIEKPAPPQQPPTPMSTTFGFNLLKWAWILMDAGMSKEDIMSITKYCELVGYLPKNSSTLIEYALDPMYKARLGGLNYDEFTLIIYNAARAAGVNIRIESLEEMAFNLLRKILKKIEYEEHR
ncbi:MAG: hypothetical protein QW743_00575 [Candidatus Methanomethylicia archaeon]